MFAPSYFAVRHFGPRHFAPGVEVTLPPIGGGGGGTQGSGPGFAPSPRPSVDKRPPLLLAQAMQEDEELIMILKEFIEVTQWH